MSGVESVEAPNSAQKKLKQRSILSMFGKQPSNESPKQQKSNEDGAKNLDSLLVDEGKDNKNVPSEKQGRQPFQNISRAAAKTGKTSKRKLSVTDSETDRSIKKGKMSESKENIADAIELKDSDVEMDEAKQDSNDIVELSDDGSEVEKEKKVEAPLLIKLPATKSKHKKESATKSKPAPNENGEEDSIVYLDEEEIRKSSKKKKSNSRKNKKPEKAKKDSTINEESENEAVENPKIAKKGKKAKKSDVQETETKSDEKTAVEIKDSCSETPEVNAEKSDQIDQIDDKPSQPVDSSENSEKPGESEIVEDSQVENSKDTKVTPGKSKGAAKKSKGPSENDKKAVKSAQDTEKADKATDSNNIEENPPKSTEQNEEVIEILDDSETATKKYTEPSRKSARKSKPVLQTPENSNKSKKTAEKSTKTPKTSEKSKTDSSKPQESDKNSAKKETKVVGALDKFFKMNEAKKTDEMAAGSSKQLIEKDPTVEQAVDLTSSTEKLEKPSEATTEDALKSLESSEQMIESSVDSKELDSLDKPAKKADIEAEEGVEPMEVSFAEGDDNENDPSEFKGFSQEEIKQDESSNSKRNSGGEKKDEMDVDESLEILISEDEDDKLENGIAGTPKQKILSESATKKLTPKQLARKAEFEKRRLEKEQLKQKEREERELVRRKEKEERDELKRREKVEKDEIRRKQNEEREKKKLAEIAEKKKKEEAREEEKRKKDEAREEEKRKKDEDRKKKDQEREDALKRKELEKEEQENKKKKAAEAFTKFFFKQKKSNCETKLSDDENSVESSETGDSISKLKFMPFRVKENMRIAPLVRVQMSPQRLGKLDEILKVQDQVTDKKDLYLGQLRSGGKKPCKSGKTWVQDDEDCVVMADELALVGTDIEEESSKLKMKCRAKFLGFSENQRPPYYGTWRKKTKLITPRKPFGQDPKFFDYEVDSDDEWEEEEPGESLHGSDDEKDKDSEGDDYEVDNEFFVPHGHLSDEEMRQMDEDNDDNSPEAQKAKLKIMQQEFAAEMKKKTEKIKPRLVGCIWTTGEEDASGGFETLEDNEKKYHCSDIIWRILKAREMLCIEDEINLAEPIIEEPPEEQIEQANAVPAAPKVSQRIKITDDSLKELILLVHGNCNRKKFLISEFHAYRLTKYGGPDSFKEFLTTSVHDKINEIADYKSYHEAGPMFGKKCWLVKSEVIQEHFPNKEEQPPIPNKWEYILDPTKKKKEKEETTPDNEDPQKPKEKPKKSKPKAPTVEPEPEALKKSQEPQKISITKYTVDLTEEEKRQQISAVRKEESVKRPAPSSPAQQPPAKKRVQLLMSVPRGQQIPEAKKNNLISQYLKTSQHNQTNGDSTKSSDAVASTSSSAAVEPMEVDKVKTGVIVLE